MSASRSNYCGYHPAVLRALARVVAAANANEREYFGLRGKWPHQLQYLPFFSGHRRSQAQRRPAVSSLSYKPPSGTLILARLWSMRNDLLGESTIARLRAGLQRRRDLSKLLLSADF